MLLKRNKINASHAMKTDLRTYEMAKSKSFRDVERAVTP